MTETAYMERLELRIEEVRTQRDSYAAQVRYHDARADRIEQETDLLIYNSEYFREKHDLQADLTAITEAVQAIDKTLEEQP